MIVRYNRVAAVSYAIRWAKSRNDKYYDYTDIGGDCTNFVSQCVYAGSRVMNYTPDFGWYYINANNKSPSWTGVDFFYNFMTSNTGIGPFGIDNPLEKLSVGDIIQIGNTRGEYYHTMLLTAVRNTRRGKQYYVSAHSQDALNKNLLSYSYDKIRGIHIMGARKE